DGVPFLHPSQRRQLRAEPFARRVGRRRMILVALVYAALAALLSASIATDRLRLPLRILGVVGAVPVAFLVWQSAQPPTGWPTASGPPKDSAFVWASVREPSPGDAGEIDLWLVPVGADKPRAYRVAY